MDNFFSFLRARLTFKWAERSERVAGDRQEGSSEGEKGEGKLCKNTTLSLESPRVKKEVAGEAQSGSLRVTTAAERPV